MNFGLARWWGVRKACHSLTTRGAHRWPLETPVLSRNVVRAYNKGPPRLLAWQAVGGMVVTLSGPPELMLSSTSAYMSLYQSSCCCTVCPCALGPPTPWHSAQPAQRTLPG